jgi:hypothetical protein
LCIGIVWLEISSEERFLFMNRTKILFWRTDLTIDLIIVVWIWVAVGRLDMLSRTHLNRFCCLNEFWSPDFGYCTDSYVLIQYVSKIYVRLIRSVTPILHNPTLCIIQTILKEIL